MAPGEARAGRVMPLFTPLRSVKTGTGLSASLEQGPRRPRPSLAEPVTPLAAPPSDNGPLSDAALAAPRPRPPSSQAQRPCGPSRLASGRLYIMGSLCKLARIAGALTRRPLRGRPALGLPAIRVPGSSKPRRVPPVRPRARRGGSLSVTNANFFYRFVGVTLSRHPPSETSYSRRFQRPAERTASLKKIPRRTRIRDGEAMGFPFAAGAKRANEPHSGNRYEARKVGPEAGFRHGVSISPSSKIPPGVPRSCLRRAEEGHLRSWVFLASTPPLSPVCATKDEADVLVRQAGKERFPGQAESSRAEAPWLAGSCGLGVPVEAGNRRAKSN